MRTLRQMLAGNQTALGLAHFYNAPGIIERIGADWDWVWIDAQHGQFGYEEVLSAVRAVELVGSRVVIRVPGHGREWSGLYADMAPAGIMVPMVNTAQEARYLVESLRFPPLGKRSFGSRRACDRAGLHYHSELDLFVIAQIETEEGFANAEAIINTEGIDCLFFGPDDFKIALGLPVETHFLASEPLQAALQQTADAAQKAGKWAGCVALGEPAVRMAVEMGYQLIACGADQVFLRDGSAAALKAARTALEMAAMDCSIAVASSPST